MKDIIESTINLMEKVLEGLSDPMVLSTDNKYCESVLEGAEVATSLIIMAAVEQKDTDTYKSALEFKKLIKQKSGHNLASLSKIKYEWESLVDKVLAGGAEIQAKEKKSFN